ncbi:Fe-S cluster assembly protein SufD [Puia sp. P3]|uniref:Fe-S cluster assembly protein SufD n=1 Tax=Puia sp. P3 TaxID=3423952 RepID=UPI003D66761D
MSLIQEPAIPLYDAVVRGYHELSAAGADVDEVSRARQSAFDQFRLLGFPSIRNEDWKYTNITRYLKDEFALNGLVPGSEPVAAVAAPAGVVAKATIPGFDACQVVLVNGVWDGKIKGELPKGIELFRVAQVLKDPQFAGYFGNGKWGNQHFAYLNTALFTDGLFIRVRDGAVVEKPLHVVNVFTSDRNLLIQPRHVIVAGRNSEASIVESVVSAAGEVKLWVNRLTEIFAKTDAKLDHVVLQTAGQGVRLVQHTTVRQQKQSLYNNYTFTLPGAELVRNDLQARLEEDHTETHLYGLYLAAGGQLVDNHTLVDHQKPHCFSNELYKGVLLEKSTGVFNGKVYVHQDAQKTNAFQQNNNLVISKQATIDSKPELEIYADDVKCSHGSTVGQFSDEALFYLRARGLGEETAKALLIAAFAFDVTEKIKHEAVEAYVNELISQHIPSQTQN